MFHYHSVQSVWNRRTTSSTDFEKGNHLSLSISTTKYRSYSILKTMRDTTDPWSIYKEKEARVNFDLVRDEIDKDVAYRPLMFRYIEAMEHFSALVDICV